ncbi:MAG: tetratricopeptide repeat protein [Chitinophagaceae bacterium]|nr:tetratricopeptide repeat protein [Chitinophagaceae bacterium]
MNNQKQKNKKTPSATKTGRIDIQKKDPIPKTPPHPALKYGIWVIISISVALYIQTFWYKYVHFDDTLFLLDNKSYFTDISNLWVGFKQSAGLEYYRPILFGSFVIDFQMGNTDPMIYHISNVFYHTVACVCLFYFLQILGYEKWQVLFTTLVFTVHPLFVQAVAWIPGRNDSILAIFTILSFIYFLRFLKQDSPKTLSYFLHIFFYAASLFAKETGMGVPIVCFFYLVCIFSTEHTKNKKNTYVLLAVGWFITTCIWFLIRKKALDFTASLGVTPFAEIEYSVKTVLYNLPFLMEAVAKFFIPYHLSVFPAFSFQITFLGIIITILLIAVVIILKPRIPFIIWASGWWFLFLIPSIMFRFQTAYTSDYLEHRVYLPAIGGIIFINEIVKRISENNFVPYFRIHTKKIGIAVICIFSLITFFHIQNFQNEDTFWYNACVTHPDDAINWKTLGENYFNKKNYAEAEKAFMQSVKINPNDFEVMFRLAEVSDNLQKTESAKYFYKKVIALPVPSKQTLWIAYSNLGTLFEKLSQNDSARFYYKHFISLYPEIWEATYTLALSFQKENVLDSAIHYYKKVLKIQPHQKNVLANIAETFQKIDQFEEAKKFYYKNLQIEPNSFKALYGLAGIYDKAKQYDSAIYFYSKTIDAYPQNWEAPLNFGVMYYTMGNIQEAEKQWLKVTEIVPSNTIAYTNLLVLYASTNRITEGKKMLQTLKSLGTDMSANFPQLQ